MSDTKLYYTIGEVANMLNVNASLLRFWEKEFDIIKPFKNKKGTRYYSPKDIDHLKQIYYLTKECGYTLEGAKERMKKTPDETLLSAEIVKSLNTIRNFLLDLKSEI